MLPAVLNCFKHFLKIFICLYNTHTERGGKHLSVDKRKVPERDREREYLSVDKRKVPARETERENI